MESQISGQSTPGKIQNVGLIIGLIGGLVFSLLTWGIDAIELTTSHAVYPWIKVLPASIIVTLLAGLAGYLSALSGRGFPTLMCWLGWGVTALLTASYLPYRISEWMITTLNPMLGNEISYPIPTLHETRLILGVIVVVVLCSIVSFLFPTAVDQVYMGMYLGPTIMNLAIWLVLFVGMAFVLDDIINKPLRRPVSLLAETIEVARANESAFDKGREASKLEILGLKSTRGVLQRPYHLALKTYSDLNEAMQVWVDFDGFWYTCNVAYSQVVNCK